VAYATWQDVKYWVDKDAALNPGETEATGPADPLTLQTYEELAETDFHNEVRGYVRVPVDATASPELYAQAKAVCAMRAAALLLKARNQAERSETMKWFDDWLEARAQKIVEQMKSDATKAPDYEVAEDPVLQIPSFGGLPSTAAETVAGTRTALDEGW